MNILCLPSDLMVQVGHYLEPTDQRAARAACRQMDGDIVTYASIALHSDVRWTLKRRALEHWSGRYGLTFAKQVIFGKTPIASSSDESYFSPYSDLCLTRHGVGQFSLSVAGKRVDVVVNLPDGATHDHQNSTRVHF